MESKTTSGLFFRIFPMSLLTMLVLSFTSLIIWKIVFITILMLLSIDCVMYVISESVSISCFFSSYGLYFPASLHA